MYRTERREDAVQSCSNTSLNVPTSYDAGRVAPTEGSEDTTRFVEFWNASEERDPRAACILTLLSTVPRPRSNRPAVRLAQIQGYWPKETKQAKIITDIRDGTGKTQPWACEPLKNMMNL